MRTKTNAAPKAAATPAGDTPAPTPSPEQRDLAKKWRETHDRASELVLELEALRVKLVAAGVEIGYEDENLVVRANTTFDRNHEQLLEVLRKKRRLEEVQETAVSVSKVRAVAELEPAVAKVLKAIEKKTPRFEAPKAKKKD